MSEGTEYDLVDDLRAEWARLQELEGKSFRSRKEEIAIALGLVSKMMKQREVHAMMSGLGDSLFGMGAYQWALPFYRDLPEFERAKKLSALGSEALGKDNITAILAFSQLQDPQMLLKAADGAMMDGNVGSMVVAQGAYHECDVSDSYIARQFTAAYNKFSKLNDEDSKEVTAYIRRKFAMD